MELTSSIFLKQFSLKIIFHRQGITNRKTNERYFAELED